MLRVAGVRSNGCLGHAVRAGARRQWQPQRIQIHSELRRTFAEQKPVAGVPTGPIQATATSNAAGASPAADATPLPPPPPKKQGGRFRRFLLTLFLLSALGYGGGVYYSLVSDNFHDFFTEYVPYGEDAIAYFEEREFGKRFPSKDSPDAGGRRWPQRRGEDKVTIGRQSGLTPQVADDTASGSDLSSKGRHLSAVEDNKAPAKKGEAVMKPKEDVKKEQAAKKEEKGTTKPKEAAGKTEAKPATAATSAAKSSADAATPLIDNLAVPSAEEPVVQDLIKTLNNIITAVDALPGASQVRSALENAKSDVGKIVADVSSLKERASNDAESKIQSAHSEFEEAAKELVQRVQREMQDQEIKWREEYESEREKLSKGYQQKLALELDAAQKVAEQKNANALLEQEILLQRKFMDDVKAQVEAEREGRLSKLDELSSSVSELDNLTTQWNNVVDATLQTQHLQVALEAVRAKVLDSHEQPTPFLNELVALKEVANNDELVNVAISSIPPTAYQRGIPSAAQLIDRFRRVALEVRKASLLPEDAGIASHAASAVLSRFMFTKKAERGLPEGEDVEATLARTESLLEEGDLDAAAREMNGLKGWAGVLSRDWVQECRRVLECRQAVDVIATEARLQSLLVD